MQRLLFERLLPRPWLYHANVARVVPGEKTQPHTHDFVEFFQVLQGTGTHCWNDQVIPLQRGDLAFIRAADRHWYVTGRGETMVFINIAVPADWWRNFCGIFKPRLSHDHFRKRPVPFHVNLPESNWSHAEAGLLALLRRQDHSGLIRACLRMVEAFAHSPRGKGESVPMWLAEIRQDMEQPQLLGRGINFWQKRSGRSKEHFARTCRRHYGVSPTDLLNRLRIEHVQLRLRTSNEKLSTLAMEVGFENLGYFYRLFRRQVGCTPRRWRISHSDPAVPRQ